ncbi:FAD-dependent oxidoreductase [Sulfobacillus harzensis]|uniref:FAD-dependent oxidoreductase n=1 Tax=Sulfobacillus harzensis TaxID=2729629 RepID=A0A7Y0L6C0_9FIRM|nr:FAD-dependent oxidoreductase [Sulfobacillus harzensis]NMP22734.1 FAD-dependent oxidoreductase [Sulfobacillus harzensis]
MRIAIIGGVAGGASAATRARRLNENADITIFEKGPYVSYANCGLPYYVGRQIATPDALLLETPESLWDRFRIRVHVNTEVTDIDLTTKRLRFVQSGQAAHWAFDQLILAPGSTPIVPKLPGMDRPDVFLLRTVPDALRLREYLDQNSIHHAAVIGAGFIGLEMAEVLRHRGLEVTLVDQAAHVLPPVDSDIAGFLESRMPDLGIQLALSNTIMGIRGAVGHPIVDLSSGPSLTTDLVVMGLGVRPSLQLARSMGLALGTTGAVQVNHRMQTSHPDVYAAGDAVEKRDLVTGNPRWWPLAGVANKEGRVAGTNAAGGNATLNGALGTGIVRLAPFVVGVTGLTEKVAERDHIPYRLLHTIRGHHAGYYPGARDVLIKLLYDPASGRILGAQAAGEEGVDKRIDVIATAIHARMTVDDLGELDLAYAPPVGAAKDPVIIAGMAAANHYQELVENVSAGHLEEWLNSARPPFLLDVRDSHETSESGMIAGAKNIPLNDLRSRLDEVPNDSPVVVYCRSGHRSYLAARILRQTGRSAVFNLSGGFIVWGLTHPEESRMPV